MRLAVVSPSFFGYERAIADAFSDHGATVTLFDERPSNTAVSRALLRLFPRLVNRRVDRHFASIAEAMQGVRYDALLVIKGENTPLWFLEWFHRANERAARLFYSFDSITNSSHCVDLFPEFDRLFSFDRHDVDRFPQLRYKPLFFSKDFRAGAGERSDSFSTSFVGTLHSDRYRFCEAVNAALPAERAYTFFYSPARWLFTLQRIFSRRFREVPRERASFHKLSRAEVAAIFKSSRAVVDFQRPGQSGLTMRTFEALAAGAALVTANPAIALEPFYSSGRVLIVPADAGSIDSAAVAEWISLLDRGCGTPADLEPYSLENWTSELLAAAEEAAQ